MLRVFREPLVMTNDFVDDQTKDLPGKRRIHPDLFRQGLETSDLVLFTLRVCSRQSDGGLVSSDGFGDLKALGQQTDQSLIQNVDPVAVLPEFRIHHGLLPGDMRQFSNRDDPIRRAG